MAFEDLDKLDVETAEFWISATKLCRNIKSIDNANQFLEKIKSKMQTKHFNLIGRKSRFNSLKEILALLTQKNTLQVLNQIGTLPSRFNSRIPSYFIIGIQDLYSKLNETRNLGLNGSDVEQYKKDNYSIKSLKNSLSVLACKLKTGKISTDIKKHLKDGYTKSREILAIEDPINILPRLKNDNSNLEECLQKLKSYNLKYKIYVITSFLEIATKMLDEILLEEKMMKNATSIGNKKTIPNEIDGDQYLSSSAMKNQFEDAKRKVKKYWDVEKFKFNDLLNLWQKHTIKEIDEKLKYVGINDSVKYKDGRLNLYQMGIVMHAIDKLLEENKLSDEKIKILNFLRVYFECVVKNNVPKKGLYGIGDKGKKLWNVENEQPKFSEDDLHQGMIGDCYLIATLMGMLQRNPKSILKCFPKLSEEVDVNGRSKTGAVTVRLYQVVLSGSSMFSNKIQAKASPTGKYMDIKIKFSTVLNIRFACHSNISEVFWPNFIEQAVTVARNIKNMTVGDEGIFDRSLSSDMKDWQQEFSNLKVLVSSTTCAVIKTMLTGHFAVGEIDLRDFEKLKENIEKKNADMKKKNSKDYMHSVIKEKYIKKYTKKELETFKFIRKKLNAGKVVTVSTEFNEIKEWKISDDFKDWDGTIRKFRSDFDLKNKTSFFESQKFFNDHEYTVENCSLDRENGEIKIMLRNPWNRDEVEGGKRVVLDLKKFCQYFNKFESN